MPRYATAARLPAYSTAKFSAVWSAIGMAAKRAVIVRHTVTQTIACRIAAGRGSEPSRSRNMNRRVAKVATAKNRCWSSSAPFGQFTRASNPPPTAARVKATAMQIVATVMLIRAPSGRLTDARTRLTAANHNRIVPMYKAISGVDLSVDHVRSLTGRGHGNASRCCLLYTSDAADEEDS